ncbi:MAG TPA: PAS domain S-box protein [Methanocella sp.]|jgi:PAS domain S-box-containing protein
MDANRKELSTIMDALGERHGGMTIMEISKAVGLNRHSVAKYMEVLVAAGQVDMRSFGPSKIFSVSRRVPIAAMLSLSSDLIVTLDRDLRARYVNDRFLEFTGLGPEEVLRKNIQNFSHSLRTDPPLMPYVTAAMEGIEGTVDVFYPRGTKGNHFILKVIPLVFEDGEKGVTLIMSDITARVEAEEALRKERGELEVRVKERTAELEAEIAKRIAYENALKESEENYRNLAENINDVAWEIDTEGRFTYISPKIRDTMGYEPAEFIGKTIVAFLAPAHEREVTKDFGRVFTRPEPYSLQETHVLHKDGHEVIVEANAIVVYDGQGRFKGYRGIIRDITARKRTEEALRLAEEKLRNTIENVNDIVWEMGPDARFTYVSPRVRDILGHGPEHYVGHVISEFMPSEDVPEFSEGFRRIYANPRPYSFEYFRMIHKNGSILSFEVNGSPFYDDSGQFRGFQGVTRDITKRKPVK